MRPFAVVAGLLVVLLAGCSGGGGPAETGAGGPDGTNGTTTARMLTPAEARSATVEATRALAQEVGDAQNGTMSSVSATYTTTGEDAGSIDVREEFAADGSRHVTLRLTQAGETTLLEAWCTPRAFVVQVGGTTAEGRPTLEDCLQHASAGLGAHLLAAVLPTGDDDPTSATPQPDGSVAATYAGDGGSVPARQVQVGPDGHVASFTAGADGTSLRLGFSHDAKRATFEVPLASATIRLPPKVQSTVTQNQDPEGHGQTTVLVQRSPDVPRLDELEYRTTDRSGNHLVFTFDECDGNTAKNGITCHVNDTYHNDHLNAGDWVTFTETTQPGLPGPATSTIYDTWSQADATPDPMGAIAGALVFGEFVPGPEVFLVLAALGVAVLVARRRHG